VRYASVMDSVRDGLYRVDDPTFAYAGKTTILEVIQTWAPSSDGNAPRAYAEQVARWINEWAAAFPPEGEAMTDDPQAQWMPSSNYTKGREGRWVSRLTGKSIGGGFLSYYEWLIQQIGEAEAIMLIGHPLTEEIRENGLVVQYFERARFEWHPGSR